MKTHILFIEDEKDLIEDMPPLLEAEGFKVTATTNIMKAIQLFKNSDFDVVLTDIAMPPSNDMDGEAVGYGRETGVEIARRMQAVKPQIPIIALTVIRDSKIIGRMRKAGITLILHKPQEPSKIIQTLKEITKIQSHSMEREDYNIET